MGPQLDPVQRGTECPQRLRLGDGVQDDPQPVRDSTNGVRVRLENGRSCPAGQLNVAGVRNDRARDLDGALAPDGTPTSGRVCVYAVVSGGYAPSLLRQRVLSGAEAARVATAARSVEIAHSTGPACPVPSDAAAAAVVLTYPGRPAINLWIETGDCPQASNGHLVAVRSPSLTALVDLVSRLAG
jgi:hypothetical protein